jgi:hypothetical protein
MHRYLVERSFAPGSPTLTSALGEGKEPTFVEAHDMCKVKWLRSYVTLDQGRCYCIVDGPSPEAVRQASRASGLPVDRISEVRMVE